MIWFVNTFKASIGKKLVMSLTGLSFCLFLAVHFIGNFFLYVGPEYFNSYVEHLHALGLLVNAAEAGLIILAVCHIIFALTLYLQNNAARPTQYAVKKNAGGQTLASRLMPYTGLYILFFVIIHLITFKFADHTGITVYDIVNRAFSSPGYLVFYAVSMILVGLHITHGLWSAFQTLGANHPKYMPAIQKLSWIYAVIIGVGFGLIPIYMFIA